MLLILMLYHIHMRLEAAVGRNTFETRRSWFISDTNREALIPLIITEIQEEIKRIQKKSQMNLSIKRDKNISTLQRKKLQFNVARTLNTHVCQGKHSNILMYVPVYSIRWSYYYSFVNSDKIRLNCDFNFTLIILKRKEHIHLKKPTNVPYIKNVQILKIFADYQVARPIWCES